jgi:hypothetical protein
MMKKLQILSEQRNTGGPADLGRFYSVQTRVKTASIIGVSKNEQSVVIYIYIDTYTHRYIYIIYINPSLDIDMRILEAQIKQNLPTDA